MVKNERQRVEYKVQKRKEKKKGHINKRKQMILGENLKRIKRRAKSYFEGRKICV